jgi:MinD superfamily P-loop ATPase
MGPDTTDRGDRGILTAREREIIRGEADVSDNYSYRVVSRVRKKITRLEADLEILDEHCPDLASELREAVCGEDSTDI